ncbi:MAG: haloacid dehalogenase [Anaerolineae bacterium]|nr:haloacid dehalogenase [Anaerolineae bacterium]MCB9129474.1 haloacid dehalogenase [Anaerolineales bacterium]MCB0230991.1 haloacid dehalogenase [Anaerolineae bacterium]MCB0233717.1 haloacid dehalogenase [Anaerolineae bacterium]MCB0243330.1 haloacid dehalogenase [Anaerolineae bacterium]
MNNLPQIIEDIRADLTARNDVRDATLRRSRDLIRLCAQSIRAVHRHEFEEAAGLLDEARDAAAQMLAAIEDLPDLFYTGYTQDALKELTEAHLVYAFVNGGDLPTPQALGVPSHTFLNGMSEAGTEMRRFALDMIRRGRVEEAEPFLAIMDEVYSQNITIDFPDAITGGLRRQTDVLRATLERTRGDVTMAMRQEQMRQALAAFEERVMGTTGMLVEAVMAPLETDDE